MLCANFRRSADFVTAFGHRFAPSLILSSSGAAFCTIYNLPLSSRFLQIIIATYVPTFQQSINILIERLKMFVG